MDLKTLQDLDADDESLVKYKQTLLGQTGDILGMGRGRLKLSVYIHVLIRDERKKQARSNKAKQHSTYTCTRP